jgi:hypothetical protein
VIIGKAITAILIADTTVSTIIGTNISAMMSPELGRQAAYPQIVYESHGADNATTNDGKSGLVDQTIRVYCLAMDEPTADALAVAVNSALMGTRKGTYGGANVSGFFFKDEDSGTDTIAQIGQDQIIYWHHLDYRVWFNLPSD